MGPSTGRARARGSPRPWRSRPMGPAPSSYPTTGHIAFAASPPTGRSRPSPATERAASWTDPATSCCNLVVTNVPGPQIPLYLLGRELLDIYPVGFLPENQALFVAIMSYNGRLSFTLLGDFDALPDIDVLADGVRESVAELLGPARQRAAETSSPSANRRKRSRTGPVKGDARTPA